MDFDIPPHPPDVKDRPASESPIMAIVSKPLQTGFCRRRWTSAEYHRMGEAGLFAGQRVELLNGVVYLMSPQLWAHSAGITRAMEMLTANFGEAAWVRSQLPLVLSPRSEPEPDISVVPGRFSDCSAHPTTALLVVEVSLSTLPLDRRTKAEIYARAGIEDYWFVNLIDRVLEVHRNPGLLPVEGKRRQNYGYRTVLALGIEESITPLARPASSIPVSRFFA